MIDPAQMINPVFKEAYYQIMDNSFPYLELMLPGGRAGGKSCFAGILVLTIIMRDAAWFEKGYIAEEQLSNAVVLRKFRNTLRESVYEQVQWGINMLGVQDAWEKSLNPLCLTYKPTGQKILFRGLDDPTKTKSIKAGRGRFSVVWYEELQEYRSMAEIRTANQSFIRGSAEITDCQVDLHPIILYSYNPPRLSSNWVNEESLKKVKSRKVIRSTYLTMPPEWLGKEFLEQAETLKKTDERAYRHEYMGEAVGSDGVIFKNIVGREFTDGEVRQFPARLQGLDFGYAHPCAFTQSYFNSKTKELFIFGEVAESELTNPELMEKIKRLTKGDKRTMIIADCEDLKSIHEFRRNGFNIKKCRKRKGKNGEWTGIKFLKGLKAIYIDPVRCPLCYKQFTSYAYKQDKEGNYYDLLPDLNEDTIDSVRYALEPYIYQSFLSIKH